MSLQRTLLSLCLSFGLTTLSYGAEEAQSPQEIRIQLTTASSLSPIYISKCHASDGSVSSSYVTELDKILTHDFNYNGKTKVLAKNEQREKAISSADAKVAFNPQEWKSQGIPYVIKVSIKQSKLQASVANIMTGSLKVFPEIQLSGSISSDRRQIHRLADSIHKALFNTDGIANTRILFSYQNKHPSSETSIGISEIWECDWDGANTHPITKDNNYCVTPVLIPKSSSFTKDMFLYVSYKSGQPKIFIATLEEGIGRKVVDIRGNQLLPAISPQRDKIAFVCDASGRTDLFVQPLRADIGLTGTPVQLFSYPRSTQASPTFSPDGSKVAFVSDKDGTARIYIIPSQRSDKRATPQLLTKKNRENSCPSWSPDGTKLAYSAKTDGIRQIWIYDFASEEETQLTSGPGNKENPCWATNSLHLVFNSTDSQSSDLYLVNLNQPEAVKITNGPGKKHYPTWGQR